MTPIKYLSHAETSILEATCANGIASLERNAIMLYTALKCGLRAQELLNLKRQDLCYETKTVRVKTLKKGMPRELPAPSCLFDFAKDLALDAPVFGIGYQRLVQIWNHYRPVKKKFHSLRHTFALNLYHKRKDINLVRKVLGHRSLGSTTVYLDEEYPMNEVRRAFGIK